MSLLSDWREKAYDPKGDQKELDKLWKDYFAKEKASQNALAHSSS